MANSWWEIQVLCDPALEDILYWRLEDFGCRGVSSETKGHACLMCGYLPQQEAQLLDLSALSLLLRQDALCVALPEPVIQWDLIDEQDWSISWKEYWKPQAIGDRFLIYPAWLEIPDQSERLLLRLEPGVAFGTGEHATTQLCLESLEMRLGANLGGVVIADVGCGSGVLSIGALLLGANRAYAVDTDPLAVKATIENRDLNGIAAERLMAEKGSVDRVAQLLDAPVDGVVCNILAEVIIDLIPQMSEIVKPSTWGIFSGLLLDQAKPVTDVLEAYGWTVATLWKRQDWCCLNVRRS